MYYTLVDVGAFGGKQLEIKQTSILYIYIYLFIGNSDGGIFMNAI